MIERFPPDLHHDQRLEEDDQMNHLIEKIDKDKVPSECTPISKLSALRYSNLPCRSQLRESFRFFIVLISFKIDSILYIKSILSIQLILLNKLIEYLIQHR